MWNFVIRSFVHSLIRYLLSKHGRRGRFQPHPVAHPPWARSFDLAQDFAFRGNGSETRAHYGERRSTLIHADSLTLILSAKTICENLRESASYVKKIASTWKEVDAGVVTARRPSPFQAREAGPFPAAPCRPSPVGLALRGNGSEKVSLQKITYSMRTRMFDNRTFITFRYEGSLP